jgi:hypothetical protein
MLKVTIKRNTSQINQIPKYLALYSKISSTAHLIPFQSVQDLLIFNKIALVEKVGLIIIFDKSD